MRIYTKTGDNGTTSLIGGVRVYKHDIRIEAYGTIDELIAHIGFLRDQNNLPKQYLDILFTIQDKLMAGSAIFAKGSKEIDIKLPEIMEEDIVGLEEAINEMDKNLPELHSFIVPGGHPNVSTCHIIRNVCRRAERRCVEANSKYQVDDNEQVIKYLNRLSDYFFVLARSLTQDYNSKEISWKPFVK